MLRLAKRVFDWISAKRRWRKPTAAVGRLFPAHPANVARGTYIEVDGITQPAPAPRFSRTPSQVRHGGHVSGQDTDAVLAAMGFGEREIAELRQAGAIA